MQDNVVVWDLETIPDLEAAGRMFGISNEPDEKVREAIGHGFPKHPLHKICCIGALVSRREEGCWQITSLGAPHTEDRTEASLIDAFASKIAELRPQ